MTSTIRKFPRINPRPRRVDFFTASRPSDDEHKHEDDTLHLVVRVVLRLRDHALASV